MGWPRVNESCRLYRERKDKSYILVIIENGRNNNGTWECIANCYEGSTPSLCGTSTSDGHLQNKCRRVQWSDLPVEWQNAFIVYMRDWDQTKPQQIRGFWRVTPKELTPAG